MEKVLEIQKKAFLEEGPPSLEKRKDLLRRCAALIETHEQKIIKALNHDFQNRSIEEIKISEIDQTLRNIFTIRKLKKVGAATEKTVVPWNRFTWCKKLFKANPIGNCWINCPLEFSSGFSFLSSCINFCCW